MPSTNNHSSGTPTFSSAGYPDLRNAGETDPLAALNADWQAATDRFVASIDKDAHAAAAAADYDEWIVREQKSIDLHFLSRIDQCLHRQRLLAALKVESEAAADRLVASIDWDAHDAAMDELAAQNDAALHHLALLEQQEAEQSAGVVPAVHDGTGDTTT